MYFLIIESDNSKSDTYPQAIYDLNVYLTNISFLCMIHITYLSGMSKMYNIFIYCLKEFKSSWNLFRGEKH